MTNSHSAKSFPRRAVKAERDDGLVSMVSQQYTPSE
jgi:hypothetical protein